MTLPAEPAAELSPDTAFGAFSDHGPWVLDLDAIPWQWDIDRIRRGTRREVPRLLASGRLPPLGRLSRTLVEIGNALGGWLVFEWRRPSSRAGISRRLRLAFERLGSSYVKLGQIISGGEGLFPDELVTEFKLLRDQVPPETFADVRSVVEIDLGGSLEELFEWFDETPIAAASIAQVHAARLRHRRGGGGEGAAPATWRSASATTSPPCPGWRRAWWAASRSPRSPTRRRWWSCSPRPSSRSSTSGSRRRTCSTSPRVLADTDQRGIIVPRPHPTLVSRRVLVMERLDGFAFDDVESMHAAGIDTHALLQAGLIASLEGAMIYGVFHGDLHGGNLVVQPDGRTALFDFGMTGRLSELQRVAFMRLLMFGTTGDERGQLAALRDLGAFPPDVDLDARRRRPRSRRAGEGPEQMSADALMAEMREVTKKLLGYGARVPKELMLFVQEHDVPEQRDRDPRARPRHAPADDVDLHVLRGDARRAASCARSASTPARRRPTPTR